MAFLKLPKIRVGGTLGKFGDKAKKATVKAVKNTGKVVGKAATSGIGKAVIGTALAVTGVGAPVAAAIGAASQAGGTLAKGGNIKAAAKAAAGGAALGAGAAVAGSGVRAIKTKTGLGGFRSTLLGGKKGLAKFQSDKTGAALDSLPKDIPAISQVETTLPEAPVLKALPAPTPVVRKSWLGKLKPLQPVLPKPEAATALLPAVIEAPRTPTDSAIEPSTTPVDIVPPVKRENATREAEMLRVNRTQRDQEETTPVETAAASAAAGAEPAPAPDAPTGFDWRKYLPFIIGGVVLLLVVIMFATKKKS